MTDAGDVSFGIETLKGVAAKLAMFLFGFVAVAYFARTLSPATFGGYFLLLSVVQFANRVPHGIGGACQKRLAEADTSNEQILALTLVTWIGATAIAAVLATLGRAQLVAFTGIENAGVLAVALFAALSLFLPLQFLLAGTGQFGVTNWIDLGREIAKTLLQFGLVLAGFGVTGMTVGFVVATALCLPVVLYYLGVRPARPTRETVVYVWDYAKFNIPSNVVGKAYTRFDVFLLGAIGLTSAVGYYEVALSLTGLATLISGVVMDGLISRTSNLASRGVSIRESVTATISYTSVIAIPMVVLVAFLGETVVKVVYGAAYLETVPFLLAIAVYRVLQTQREPLDSAVKGMGHPDAILRISTMALAANLALGVALVLAVGPIGVVLATIVAEVVRWLLLHRTLRAHDSGVPVLPGPLRGQLSGAVAMAAVMAAITVVLPATTGTLAVAGAVGLVTYLAAFLAQDRRGRRSLLAAGQIAYRSLEEGTPGYPTTR